MAGGNRRRKNQRVERRRVAGPSNVAMHPGERRGTASGAGPVGSAVAPGEDEAADPLRASAPRAPSRRSRRATARRRSPGRRRFARRWPRPRASAAPSSVNGSSAQRRRARAGPTAIVRNSSGQAGHLRRPRRARQPRAVDEDDGRARPSGPATSVTGVAPVARVAAGHDRARAGPRRAPPASGSSGRAWRGCSRRGSGPSAR